MGGEFPPTLQLLGTRSRRRGGDGDRASRSTGNRRAAFFLAPDAHLRVLQGDDMMNEPERDAPAETRVRAHPPAVNVPAVVLLLGAAFLAVHGFAHWLDDAGRLDLLERFSFVPAFYGADAERLLYPEARFWAPVSYGFLHGDWMHVGVNCIWLLAFGTPVAKRFGAARFLLFTFLGFAAGAAAHYVARPDELAPLVGASGAVSAYFGAAARFALLPGRMGSDAALRLPAATLAQTLTTRATVIFIVVWLGLNWVVGSGVLPLGPEGVQIAWEAHVGGFVLGLFGFALFDPARRAV